MIWVGAVAANPDVKITNCAVRPSNMAAAALPAPIKASPAAAAGNNYVIRSIVPTKLLQQLPESFLACIPIDCRFLFIVITTS